MFNRSKKYIILLIINIIILVAAYVSSTQEPSDPFDTNYVISLLENETKFKKTIRELESRLLSANNREDGIRNQLEQTQLLINTSEQKYNACESEKQSVINEVKSSAESLSTKVDLTQCRAQSIELSIAKNKTKVLEQQLDTLGNEHTSAQEELIRVNQLLAQAQNQNNTELKTLRVQLVELEQALKEPVAIQTNYLSARYCSKPKFYELICIQEFLVRPTFTKSPITKVGIKILDANDTVVAEGEYNSAKSQLYRLTMGRGKEIPSGLYHVVYSIDNRTLRSQAVTLSQ